MTNIDSAAKSLDSALAKLEAAVDALFEKERDPVTSSRELDALLADRARLAEDLDAAIARERELQLLADEASEALGSAIAEVRAALEQSG